MGKKKMKENEVVETMKDEVEKVTGLKCKVVPESDTWYDGFCLDTGNLSLHMFLLDDFEENLLRIKKYIERHNEVIVMNGKYKISKKNKIETITLINNGLGRNLSRLKLPLPFESN
jgi:hypothetical protein|tara:strand:+ start:196 stop:543 length:348 start_codon:yes stop_codon:yes gene_type:complete